MQWRDEGILLSARRHGESAAIIEALTEHHGRHAGVVRGGAGRRMAPVLQPGARLALDWSARLDEHIGTYRVEPLNGVPAAVLADGAALAVLGSVVALLAVGLAEREAHGALYRQTRDLVAGLGGAPGWPAGYALWEREFLREMGFGLDLGRCAVTGRAEDLVYVSPRSGRAVSREAGAPWAERLLPLPGFLRDAAAVAGPGDVAAALTLTGFFLEAWVAPSLPRAALPAARGRAVAALERLG